MEKIVGEGDFIGVSGLGQGLPEISSSLPVQAAHRLARANKIPAVQDEGVANSKANLG